MSSFNKQSNPRYNIFFTFKTWDLHQYAVNPELFHMEPPFRNLNDQYVDKLTTDTGLSVLLLCILSERLHRRQQT